MATDHTGSASIIRLTDQRKSQFIHYLQEFYHDTFDEELSNFKAEQLLRFIMKTLGPPVYNQAVQDARTFLYERIEDLDAALFMKNTD